MAKMALIFGSPEKGGPGKMDKEDGEGYDKDIPADFRDHCEAAFDALKKGKSSDFCEELWLAIKAYEETPHEEREEGEEPDGEDGEEAGEEY